MAGGSTFRALRKACRKLRAAMQATKDRYLEVYAGELEKLIKAGDMRSRYGHSKVGWRFQGKNVGSAQYIKEDDGKLIRSLEEIYE